MLNRRAARVEVTEPPAPGEGIRVYPFTPTDSIECRSPPPRHHRDDGEDEEDDEQDLADPRGLAGDPTEPEHGGDQGHDEESQRPAEHVAPRNRGRTDT